MDATSAGYGPRVDDTIGSQISDARNASMRGAQEPPPVFAADGGRMYVTSARRRRVAVERSILKNQVADSTDPLSPASPTASLAEFQR
jgi:hypothetical protein